MTTQKLYICDTCCLISYFNEVFESFGAVTKLSTNARSIICDTLNSEFSDYRISIPSVVFCEIYDKWLKNEEDVKMFYYKVFIKLSECPHIEIKQIDKEVLIKLISISDELEEHEIFDKIVVASALELECPIITTDTKIIEYYQKGRGISGILN